MYYTRQNICSIIKNLIDASGSMIFGLRRRERQCPLHARRRAPAVAQNTQPARLVPARPARTATAAVVVGILLPGRHVGHRRVGGDRCAIGASGRAAVVILGAVFAVSVVGIFQLVQDGALSERVRICYCTCFAALPGSPITREPTAS